MPEEQKKRDYRDCEAKKRWDKQHVTMLSVKFFDSTDADILEYFDKHVTGDMTRPKIIKQGLRLLIEQEKNK